MRLVAIAAALLFVSTAAQAQVCYLHGDTMTCSNGTTGFRYRNSTADPNVTPRRHDTTPYRNPEGAFYGSITTFSDGRTAYTYGSTTVTADGRSCYRYGSALICSRVHQGPASSFSYSPPQSSSRRGLQ